MQALVIDDSRAMRMVLARMLSNLGFDVDQAADGRLGLDHLETGATPDVIMVDWHMPEMEGIEFVAMARSSEYAYPGRIIMVTTETESAQVARALELGADEYLMKPFTEDAIADKLALLGLDP
ncbi:MAG: two-component system, chemotaxis family, chemotaxis protein CheY [Actinomycetota bacterium]|nr:two-component system, chemotaxis family, chemotaxis protein CheY [Actinomycetota bacterium]